MKRIFLSDLENDVKQPEESYIRTNRHHHFFSGLYHCVYSLCPVDQFYLGLIFILFYSFPVLCSAIGSKRLDSLSEKRSTVNQNYLASLTNFIGGSQQIRHYQGQDYFLLATKKQLQTSLDAEINYENNAL